MNHSLSETQEKARLKSLTLIILTFILSRIIFFLMGIRFDAAPLNYFWQYIDLILLENKLLESLFYLHSQPPLFNLFIGIILKLFPHSYALAFNLVYLILGLTLSISIFLLMVRLGISNKLSVILTIIFLISPTVILYENWLFYSYPLVTFLCISALFLHRFLSNKRAQDGVIFFTLLAILLFIRSMFVIYWFLIFVIILITFQRANLKKIMLTCCIPLAFIIFLYVKNLFIFKIFATSSWLGPTLSMMTVDKISEDQLGLLVSQGKLSSISVLPAFSSLQEYKKYLPQIQKTGIAVLDQEISSTGTNNYNNVAYLYITRQNLKDSIYIIINYPRIYLVSVLKSFYSYFIPSSDYRYVKIRNRKYIENFDNFYNILFYGKLLPSQATSSFKKDNFIKYYTYRSSRVGLFLVIYFLISIFYGFRLILNSLFRKNINLPFALTIVFLWLNILYITFVSNIITLSENQRFRFNIDPFMLIFLGLFIQSFLAKINPLSTRRNS